MGTNRDEPPIATDRPCWPEGAHYRYRRGGHEFTHALHHAIREQALEPFCGAIGDHALAWLNRSEGGLIGRAAATRCGPAFWPNAGHPARQKLTDRKTRDLRTRRGADRPQLVGSSTTAGKFPRREPGCSEGIIPAVGLATPPASPAQAARRVAIAKSECLEGGPDDAYISFT
jgi:hypothetical protein